MPYPLKPIPTGYAKVEPPRVRPLVQGCGSPPALTSFRMLARHFPNNDYMLGLDRNPENHAFRVAPGKDPDQAFLWGVTEPGGEGPERRRGQCKNGTIKIYASSDVPAAPIHTITLARGVLKRGSIKFDGTCPNYPGGLTVAGSPYQVVMSIETASEQWTRTIYLEVVVAAIVVRGADDPDFSKSFEPISLETTRGTFSSGNAHTAQDAPSFGALDPAFIAAKSDWDHKDAAPTVAIQSRILVESYSDRAVYCPKAVVGLDAYLRAVPEAKPPNGSFTPHVSGRIPAPIGTTWTKSTHDTEEDPVVELSLGQLAGKYAIEAAWYPGDDDEPFVQAREDAAVVVTHVLRLGGHFVVGKPTLTRVHWEQHGGFDMWWAQRNYQPDDDEAARQLYGGEKLNVARQQEAVATGPELEACALKLKRAFLRLDTTDRAVPTPLPNVGAASTAALGVLRNQAGAWLNDADFRRVFEASYNAGELEARGLRFRALSDLLDVDEPPVDGDDGYPLWQSLQASRAKVRLRETLVLMPDVRKTFILIVRSCAKELVAQMVRAHMLQQAAGALYLYQVPASHGFGEDELPEAFTVYLELDAPSSAPRAAILFCKHREDTAEEDPFGVTLAHEIGHCLYLPHPHKRPGGAGEWLADRHDPAASTCLMSYSKPGAARELCGICQLRLRGWPIAAPA